MANILLISNDVIGPTMAGPGIRYIEMARVLAKKHTVAIAGPEPSEKIEGIRTLIYKQNKPKTLIDQLKKSQVVISQSLHPSLLRVVKKEGIRFIADLYDPIVLENLEAQSELDITEQELQNVFFHNIMNTQLALADHILCASERQRDYWLGALTSLGRLSPELYRSDQSLNSLISILPFGYQNKEPKITNKDALKALVPHFDHDKDHLLIWGGGIWNWFDPLSLIKAVAKIADKRNDIKLLFLGTKHPNPNTPEMKMLNQAHQLAEELKVKDSHVFFNEGWVPYDELANYFGPAAVGVSTHFDHAETRMSFRTRILSYIWSGLPIISTKGDAMSDLIEREGLGLTVDYKDVEGLVESITKIIDNTKLRNTIIGNLGRIWPQFTWDELCLPLSHRIEKDNFTNQELSTFQFNSLLMRYYTTGLKKVWQKNGFKGLLAKLIGK